MADLKEVYLAALRLLARREHSVYELEGKLIKRGFSQTEVLECLNDLEVRGDLSDHRYKEMRTRSLLNNGYGFRFIERDLREHRISISCDEFHRIADETQWDEKEMVRKLVQKKRRFLENRSRGRDEADSIERKIQSFLYKRGF